MNETISMELPTKTVSSYKDGRTSVLDFYRGKKVFLTGGTGFLGKVTIEKLLKDFEVEVIYVLIREKKGKNIHARIDDLTDDGYFDDLKRKDPKFKHKFVPISGDCAISGLGISISDTQTLIENADIVIHCAATVRFNERLDKAYGINVNGTKAVINLAHQMKNLKAFMHVSTAYANCHELKIDERFYDYKLSVDDVAAMIAKLSPEEVEAKWPEIRQNWPNTYSFTKALAESLVRKECKNLPVTVFRPAIILATEGGASPGWIDNYYGPVAITASVYAGMTRCVHVGSEHSCNLVPVDKVVDAMIGATWEVGTRPNNAPNKNEIIIYNYVSTGTPNEITWYEFGQLNLLNAKQYPLLSAKREYSLAYTHSKLKFELSAILYHFLPALLIDLFSLLSGTKPKMFNMFRKMREYIDTVEFFKSHAWEYESKNIDILYDKLSYEDRELLPMRINDVNWWQYFNKYILGVRKYLLKESESNIEEAREHYRWVVLRNNIIKWFFFVLVASYVFNTFTSITSRILLS